MMPFDPGPQWLCKMMKASGSMLLGSLNRTFNQMELLMGTAPFKKHGQAKKKFNFCAVSCAH